MAELTVDVLAELDRRIEIEELFGQERSIADQPGLAALRQVRAVVANLIAERDALHWALVAYPTRNTHQLQAKKVCDGVVSLAVVRVGGASHG